MPVTSICKAFKYFKVSGLGKISLYNRKLNTTFSDASKAVGDELNSKYNLIRQSASDGYKPYGAFMEEIVDELAKRFPNASFEMLRYGLVRICCEQYQNVCF